tara:strand:- start:1441 stop:1812 length:372 start_codon:yes stop_codon:yes gene_type:complete
MSTWQGVKSIFTGGAIKSIENIASEWIETDLESAEAKVLMVKTLDPNGKMRRDLSNRVTALYTLYIVTALILLICESFGLGDIKQIAVATTKVTELFLPITALFGTIVTASFGVNYANTKQNK